LRFPKERSPRKSNYLPVILNATGLQIVQTMRQAQVMTIPISPERKRNK